jgi:TrmH family RNA methyltransferase
MGAEGNASSTSWDARSAMGMSKARRRLLNRLADPRLRAREGHFLVEGTRAVRETLRATLPLEIRFAMVSPRLRESDPGRELAELLSASPLAVEEVTDGELDATSDTSQTQGVLMVLREPADPLSTLAPSGAPRVLLLDGVQDPGNAGTLVRVARGFGVHAVFFLEGSVDPWNAKVVRSMAGAFAHVPVVRIPLPDALTWLQERGVPLYVADPGGASVREFDPGSAWGLAVGNEGSGPRTDLLRKADRVLSIPMVSGMDSLNVATAASILLFALSARMGP